MSDSDKTFPQLLMHHASQRPDAPAMREKALGIWQVLSWRELAALVRALACGLAAAGLQRGQHVVIVGANRPRLYATMLATQSLGAIPVPLYQDATAAEMAFPIGNAEVRFAIVEDQEQLDKLLEVRESCTGLNRIWFDDPRGLRNMNEPGVASLDTLVRDGTVADAANPASFDEVVAQGDSRDVAALFFTSGTTGQPKGVVHTHAALIDRSRAGARFDAITAAEEVLAYLPPAWVGQNIFSYAMWLTVGYVVNCPESSETVSIDLKEIGPTYYFAPPRIFEAFLTSVSIRMEDAGPLMRRLYDACMRVAARVGPAIMDGGKVGAVDRLRYRLGDLLVYAPLRNALGMSRVRVAYTAGEAIGPDLFRFYRSIGINLKQLYGSTETAVFVCLQPDDGVRAETVGVPIDGVQLRISDRGEVLVRSPGLLKGYYKNPEATAEVLDPEGWYRTGDAGFLDATGQLRILDRAKDVGKLADGTLFAPKYIENKLKFFSFVKEAVAFGDGREGVCCFVCIDAGAVGNWAERRNLAYAGFSDLSAKPEVAELVRSCVEKVNADLASDDRLSSSQIRRFLVLHKELDADDGELTRTNKIRRSVIAQRYGVLVDALYAGLDRQHVETTVTFEDGRTGLISADLRLFDAKTFEPQRSAA